MSPSQVVSSVLTVRYNEKIGAIAGDSGACTLPLSMHIHPARWGMVTFFTCRPQGYVKVKTECLGRRRYPLALPPAPTHGLPGCDPVSENGRRQVRYVVALFPFRF